MLVRCVCTPPTPPTLKSILLIKLNSAHLQDPDTVPQGAAASAPQSSGTPAAMETQAGTSAAMEIQVETPEMNNTFQVHRSNRVNLILII